MSKLDGLLAWCLEHIKCDVCETLGARLERLPDGRLIFLCASDKKLLTEVAPLDQPPLFSSTTGEEETPENT